MQDRFPLNQMLLAEASQTLGGRQELFWLLGGSCTGKSSTARLISEQFDVDVLDMDGLIYGQFGPLYLADRHPAAKEWFGSANPLDWALSLSWKAFDALNRASNVEFLDLLASDIAARPTGSALLIDGGFTHPSVLVAVAPVSNIVCLAADDDSRHQTWETDENRQIMKQWVLALPDGEAKWRKFLYFDLMMATSMVAESEALGVPVIKRREDSSVEAMAQHVVSALGLARFAGPAGSY